MAQTVKQLPNRIGVHCVYTETERNGKKFLEYTGIYVYDTRMKLMAKFTTEYRQDIKDFFKFLKDKSIKRYWHTSGFDAYMKWYEQTYNWKNQDCI